MQLTHVWLQNWLCHRHLDEPLAPLTVVCGPNHSGKSAILDAIAFVMTGDLRRVQLKGDRDQLLTEGSKSGTVRVAFVDGRIQRDVVTGKPASDNTFSTVPSVTQALPFVVDRERFCRVDANQRRLLLQALMNVDLGRAGLVKRLLERGHSKELLDKVMKLDTDAPVADWLEQAERGASEARGAWKAIAGQPYGSERAKAWEAPGPVDPPFRKQVEDAAAHTRQVQYDERAIQVALQVQAVTAARTERQAEQIAAWSKLADTLASEEPRLADAKLKMEAAGLAAEQAASSLHATGDFDGIGPEVTCPACKAEVMLVDGQLILHKPATFTNAEIGSLREASEMARAVAIKLASHYEALRNRCKTASTAKVCLDQAQKETALYPSSPTTTTDLQEQLVAKQAELSEAIRQSNRLTLDYSAAELAAEQTARADGYHASVTAWVALRDALQPDGVPGELLASALQPFNATLRAMAAETGWPQVTLTSEVDVLYDNRAHGLLSRSERWRADAMLAVAVAIHSNLRLVGLDEFDVLDVASRGQAMGWLYGLTKGPIDTVIVLATLKAAPPVPPDVGVIWLGQSAAEVDQPSD